MSKNKKTTYEKLLDEVPFEEIMLAILDTYEYIADEADLPTSIQMVVDSYRNVKRGE